MDQHLFALAQRVATLEEKGKAQAEAVDELTRAVDSLIRTIENSKGSIKMLGWIIGGATTIGTAVNWAINIWHRN